MSDIAIQVDKLGKMYRIGAGRERHDTLRDAVMGLVRRRPPEERDGTEFWALRDVSFEVKRGEVIGVIGRNGAGKSTLLKILSRITEPSEGKAILNGRVGSLLEVGTGFHPELTGRENVYLSGAILGMQRGEIERQFDEIVAFAEIEKFLDTPVKRYSSGMYVRLAFAVAAHLNPEILLVDEVLAVGDAQFQKKCLGKMGQVADEGRTVLFVSHNMGAIQSLCERAVVLKNQRVLLDGDVNEAVSAYLASMTCSDVEDLESREDRRGRGQSRIVKVDVFGDEQAVPNRLVVGRPAKVRLRASRLMPTMKCIFTFYDSVGNSIASFDSSNLSEKDKQGQQMTDFWCVFDRMLLTPGQYRINVQLETRGDVQDHVEGAAVFDVVGGVVDGRVVQGSARFSVHLPHHWIVPVA